MKYQLEEFAESLRRHGYNRRRTPKSWREAFQLLSETLEKKPAGRKMPNFWSSAEQTQTVRIWCGHAFERVALQHIDQIKAKLGISGVITRVYGWRCGVGGDSDSGTQIDLVIDRDDRVTNLCEVKYRKGEFVIDDKYDLQLQSRREMYIDETRTANAVHLTMVTVNGVRRNANWHDIQSEVTLDDLFKE